MSEETFEHLTISVLKKSDWDEPHIMTAVGIEKPSTEWTDVMIPVKGADRKELARLKQEEVMRLPRPMTEEEYREWHSESVDNTPEELQRRIDRIRDIYDIEYRGEEE